MGSIQLGIGQAIGALNKYDERDLLMQDFMTVETTNFPKQGSSSTPAHSFSDYTFKTYAPLAFRYFLNLFGIPRSDFLVSLVSKPMRELSNPGASGSIFYLTDDDEFILKTVQHKEAEFLQKLLPGTYERKIRKKAAADLAIIKKGLYDNDSDLHNEPLRNRWLTSTPL